MSKGESEELNPPELTIRNSNCFPASILQDTSENTMGSNASSSSNSSTTNNASNIKIENTNSYYCNSYSNPLQSASPAITSITGGYSELESSSKSLNFSNQNFCLSSVDANSGFSVILRPGDQLNSNPGHDSLSLQRYATHPAARLVSVSQSRQDEVLLHQHQQHSALTQQAVSPGSVFYQHSPSASDVNSGDNHNQEGDGGGSSSGPNGKYSECQTNGHDTLSDFVTFVCQETEQGQNQNHRNSPKSQQYPQYNTMLPPPPLPPMARPVAIIRSSDLTMVNSPPTSITPPTTMSSSPHQDHHESHMSQNDVNQSPPLSPQSQMDRKRIASPYSNGRDYTFNHFHTPQTQVTLLMDDSLWTLPNCVLFAAFQLSKFNIDDVRGDKPNKLESLFNPSYDPAYHSTESME